jgi:hypothetical protein
MNLASEERSIRTAIVACNGIQALVVVLKVRFHQVQPTAEALAGCLADLRGYSAC